MSNNSTLVLPPTTSSSNVASTLQHDEVEIIISTVAYVLLALLIILGNVLVIAAVSSYQRLRTINNTFLVGLAVSDLLVGLMSIPLWIYFSSCQQHRTCVNSTELVTFYSTIDIFTGIASILQLTAISIERYLAITRPINHRSYSMWIYYAMITTAWVFAFIIAGLYPVQQNKWQKPYSVILVTTCFVIPTLVILTVYAIIFQTARGTQRARVHPDEAAERPATIKYETKIAVTIAVITGLFVIAWLPFFVVNLFAEFCLKCLPHYPNILRLIRFMKWMHYSNSMVNPLVYAYRNTEMRKTFKKILASCFSCNRSSYNNFVTSDRTGRLSRHKNPPERLRSNRRLNNHSSRSKNSTSEGKSSESGLKSRHDSLRNGPFVVTLQPRGHSSP